MKTEISTTSLLLILILLVAILVLLDQGKVKPQVKPPIRKARGARLEINHQPPAYRGARLPMDHQPFKSRQVLNDDVAEEIPEEIRGLFNERRGSPR